MSSFFLTKKDFLESNCKQIIEADNIKENYKYSQKFYEAMRKIEQNGSEKQKLIYKLLGDITSYSLDLDSKDIPYHGIENLTNQELSFLGEIIDEINNEEITARVADILWVKGKKFKMAITALEAYIKAYENLMASYDWTEAIDRLERAVQLLGLFRKGETRDRIIKKIEDEIEKYKKEKPSFLLQRLIELLLKVKKSDILQYAELSRKLALSLEESKEWRMAREYWNLCAECFKYEKNFTQRDNARKASANTYVIQAHEALNEPPIYAVAASHLNKAIEAYRRIEGTAKIVQNLHKEMLEYQKKSVAQMQEIVSESIDITEIINNVTDKVKGKSFHEKIFLLGTTSSTVNIKKLHDNAKKSLEGNILERLLPTVNVNLDGKVTGKSPSLSLFDPHPEDYKQAVEIEMHKQAQYEREFFVKAVIEPVRKQIYIEHFIMLRHIAFLVSNNPFIPEGREEIYARGLYAGFNGDFLVSTHLLIPQLENSIRYILSKEGEIVSNLDKNGVQEEKNLNTLLYMPKLKELLGENLVFDLQSLLVEKFGYNLRNVMSHGLSNYNEFYSTATIYTWWIVLRICCFYQLG
ncbi:DUF4209 domain-containing protein [Priestia megaterium]|uniref:DUF4209 domain-containing protein n=1 Tax=Priestia megaterium TaxID=1404 RepID=UPI002A6A3FE6|nr:DUF4209 domain-containing protein [Priestia megaterium]MDY0943423.1 DUF4209 domain-containing protein [Priestia megaterium]